MMKIFLVSMITLWANSSLAITPDDFKHVFFPLPDTAPMPKDNIGTPGKIHLGRQLYHDPRLSIVGTVSCATCHSVMGAGTDNRPGSVGIRGQVGGRVAPTVWNAAFQSVQFWDGRAKTLEEQAIGPITNPIEMGFPNHEAALERIRQIPGYVEQFEEVYKMENAVTLDHLAKAIAAYERTLITPNAPFDKWLKGNKKAITHQAKEGAKLVMDVGCITCHSGVNFSGPKMPIGEGFYQKFPLIGGSEYEKKYDLKKDKGRYDVTKDSSDMHKYRVPTWRNIALTAPYFHNGKVKSLDEAVRVMGKTQLGKDLTEDEVSKIVAFLNSLTGEFPKQEIPVLPPTPGKTFF